MVINDPWIVKILGEKEEWVSVVKGERERERERVSLMGEEKVGKVGESRPRRCSLREIDAGETTGRTRFDEFLRNEF